MKFVLDECIPVRAATWLRENGYEAATMKGLRKTGVTNGKVAEHVISSSAVLLTCDSDFLSLKKKLLQELRFIYVKVHPRTTSSIILLLDKYLHDAIELLHASNHVTITSNGPQA